MALITNELEIVNLHDLLDKNLAIPDYQRPYRWSIKSTNTLFTDIYTAYKENLKEYRLGSVILHHHDDKYDLVDGQQRTTTLAILIFAIKQKLPNLDDSQKLGLLDAKYSNSSFNAIVDNLELLNKRLQGLDREELKSILKYIENDCTLVKIVTDQEQEAFQFFDSQNSRGKALKPQDLLKAYHLREMNVESETLKSQIIAKWENLNQDELDELFTNHLYPLTQWVKNRQGIDYSTSKIQFFKGIKSNNTYNYAIYHKSSNLFVEQFNNSGSNELLKANQLTQYQLTQPIIAGKRFFGWTINYYDLFEKVNDKIDTFYNQNELIKINDFKGSGDSYVKILFENVMMLFADRFGMESIDDIVIKQLFTWSYSLRLVLKAVRLTSINKYALGNHDKINEQLNLFNRINEMMNPEEVNEIILDNIGDIQTDDKYKVICEKLKEWNGW